jgi:protein tyrosine phosphatase (PTP) superfamily phosphohydrolase (DUF442 family)
MGVSALEKIYNFQWMSEKVATSGQPKRTELDTIAQAGFRVIINLGLHNGDYAISDEKEHVKSLGMDYIHIPVAWEKPTREDLDRFLNVMNAYSGQRCFVHCAANKRVSVFMALHRIINLGWPRSEAELAIREIWTPNEIWLQFYTSELDKKSEIKRQIPAPDYYSLVNRTYL